MAWGCVGAERTGAFEARAATLAQTREAAANLRLSASEATRAGFKVSPDGQSRSLTQLLGHPEITLNDLARVWPQIADWPAFAKEQIEIDAAYRGYLARQDADIAIFRREEDLLLPPGLDYGSLGGLSAEVREKLAAVEPATLGQAARIEGVTPGALTALLAHVRRRAA
jgi:tRNA uridine 5-carboxymethylaminomethyl modification enzyme